MDSITIGLLGIAVLLLLLFLGMHIGAAMMCVGIAGIWLLTGKFGAALGVLKVTPFTVTASFNMSVVPMFVLMGNLAFHSGVSADLYAAFYRLMGHMRGGLAVATIAACAGFSSICGSATATTVTMATVCLPEMKKYNYKPELTCGSICAGGSLGILIPPSVGFILYGINAEIAIGRLFVAGILPGLLLTAAYMAMAILLCRLDPEAAQKGPVFTAKEKLAAFKNIGPVAMLFVVVLGGIFLGWFTPNEGGAIGATGSFLVLLFRRKATVQNVTSALRSTIQTSAMVQLILIGAYIFGYFLTLSKLPSAMSAWAVALDVSPYWILIFILGVYAVLGCFIDSLPLIVLLTPIFLPIIKALGFDPVWFGVLMVMDMQLGLLTPPVSMLCFVMKGIAKDIPLGTIFKGVAPFVIPLVVSMLLVTIFPRIATWLPGFM